MQVMWIGDSELDVAVNGCLSVNLLTPR